MFPGFGCEAGDRGFTAHDHRVKITAMLLECLFERVHDVGGVDRLRSCTAVAYYRGEPSSSQSRGDETLQTPSRHESSTVQKLPSAHGAPFGSLVCRQVPAPLQVSVLSHSVSNDSPQGVPGGAMLGEQLPIPSQVSAELQSVVDMSPQSVPSGTKLEAQVPSPLHVSGSSQSLPLGSPQPVPLANAG